ncbi:MAG: FtsK/SpoIIIE domain-containing protein [Pseudomonadota bacterium]
MSFFEMILDGVADRNRRKHPIASGLGEALGRSWVEGSIRRQAERERTAALRRLNPAGNTDDARMASLVARARENGAISYLPKEFNGDAADLANLLERAERQLQEDARVREQAQAWWNRLQATDLHDDFSSLDFEQQWIGFGWHASDPSATMNKHSLQWGNLGLGPLYHLSRFEQRILDEAGNHVDTRIEIDGYPVQCLPSPFHGIRWNEHLPHPMVQLQAEHRQAGIRVFSCVTKLGIRLDDWVSLPLELASMDGNSAFNHYRLDVEAARSWEYPFIRLGGVTADAKIWQSHAADISRILKREISVDVDPSDRSRLILTDEAAKIPLHPVTLPSEVFGPEHLREGQLYVGPDRDTGEQAWLDVRMHPSMLIAGQSGCGKSTLMNVLIAGALHNNEAYETIHLVDLKGGVEFADYEDARPNVSLIEDYEALPALFRSLNDVIKQRLKAMRKREKFYSGKTILVVFDELATITHVPLPTREAKVKNAQLIADIAHVLMKGRAAGVKVIAATQRPHADAIPTSIRFNMGARMCGKVFERSVVANVFGDAEELGDIRPADFRPGCFYSDFSDGQRRLIQAPLVANNISELIGPSEQESL